MSYTIEMRMVVHDDNTGSNFVVMEDRDGLDMIELSYNVGDSRAPFAFPAIEVEMAEKVAANILLVCEHIKKRKSAEQAPHWPATRSA